MIYIKILRSIVRAFFYVLILKTNVSRIRLIGSNGALSLCWR
jgi:hypothetical protein